MRALEEHFETAESMSARVLIVIAKTVHAGRTRGRKNDQVSVPSRRSRLTPKATMLNSLLVRLVASARVANVRLPIPPRLNPRVSWHVILVAATVVDVVLKTVGVLESLVAADRAAYVGFGARRGVDFAVRRNLNAR